MALPATFEVRRRLRDSYDLDRFYGETMGRQTADTKEGPLRALAALLEATGTPYALIGGVAVQLHSREPRTTRDIDIAVPTFADVPRAALEQAGFLHEGRFPRSDDWRAPGPGSRTERTPVQFSAEDVGIADAVARAQVVDIEAGLRLPVATAPDLVILKLAAAAEPSRRSSKRQQDLADVTKLAEEHPKALPDIEQRIAAIGTTIFTVKLKVNAGDDHD